MYTRLMNSRERTAKTRKKMRDLGYIRVEVWAKPEDKVKIKEFASERRELQEMKDDIIKDALAVLSEDE